MHIEFRRLTLHNFISFGHSSLNITDDGFIRVTGINENPEDSAISNGSGKSSIWEGIVWALTGETIRGTKQVSNIYGTDGTYVELDFNIDNVNYVILRSKDHKEYKTNLRIYIDGKDCSGKGIRDSEKLLSEYLPDITASLLGSVIILGQGLPQKFTNNSPSGRKEVLEKLSKSDFMIEDLKTRVTNRKNELTTILRTLQDSAVEYNSSKSTLMKQIETAKSELSNMNNDLLVSNIHTITVEIDELQEKLEREEESVQKYTLDGNKIIENYQSKETILNSSIEEQRNLMMEATQSLSEELNSLKVNKSSLEKELRKLQSIKDICPTCGQKLPDVHKPDTSSLETMLLEIEKDLSKKSLELNNLQQSYQIEINRLVECRKELQTDYQTSTTKNNSLISSSMATSTSYRNSISKKSSELSKLQIQLAQFETTKASHESVISRNSAAIQELDDKLMYNTNEQSLQQSHLDVVNKFDTALKRDFRGYLLTTIIEYIEKRAKMYCKIIFETDMIGFCLDGNNIDISYLGKSYENLSGGEKQKIDLIVQFSIRDMLCTHLGFTSNILVLDEVFDGLDMIGCQRVLDVISAIEDIKNIFIVTHRKDLAIPTDKELIVVKSASGFSEIR